MSDQILTVIICVGLPFLLTIAAAIISPHRRMKMANKIITGIRQGEFNDYSTPRIAARIRLFSNLALASITGFYLIVFLSLTKIWSGNPVMIIALLIMFSLVGVISGTLLSREVTNRVK